MDVSVDVTSEHVKAGDQRAELQVNRAVGCECLSKCDIRAC